jgi:class 3 adenylate cyclase
MAVGYLIGALIDQLEQSRDAERRAGAELADLNANLESKVNEQVDEVERLGRLRRFLSAPVAEAVLESSDESKLAPHRREIAVLFCDLRGFTAFTKQVEPEEVMEVLDAYYAASGEQITKFQATLGSFEGDGLMAYLNDPVPCDEPARRVVEMGLAVADAIDALTPSWDRRGYDLSYGIGMALGHATLGIVGYDGRSDYTAMGTVVNLGARLCGTAQARELVADRRVFLQTEDVFTFARREPVMLKGFGEPVANYLVDRS